MRRGNGRRVRIALAAVLILTVAGTTETSAATEVRRRAPRPDLTVVAAGLSVRSAEEQPGGRYYIMLARTGQFTWLHRTRNVGAARAAASRTAVRFDLGRGRMFTPPAARLPVPRLAPGAAISGAGRFRVDLVPPRFKFGTYPTLVCADAGRVVAESREGNNCRRAHPIYVVPEFVTGRITGRALHPLVFPGVTLSWESRVTFGIQWFQRNSANGIFDYHWFRTGRFVRYRVSGTNSLDGCSWNGVGAYHPSFTHDSVGLSFFRPRGRFTAQLALPFDFSFTVTVSCPGGTTTTHDFSPWDWGNAFRWLDTGTTLPRFADPGWIHLKGRYVGDNPSFPVTYTWDLFGET
jgi:hypothetical protein